MESVSQIVATKRARSENYQNEVGVTPTKTNPPEWIKLKAKVDNLTSNFPEYFKTRRISKKPIGKKEDRKMRYEVAVEHWKEDGVNYLIELVAIEKDGVAIKVWYVGYVSLLNACYRRILVDIKQGESTAF